jgi:hypothetical protein
MITTNNSKFPARIRYTRRDGNQMVITTDRGNARRYMMDNLAEVAERFGMAAKTGHPMMDLFASCKARVEVFRYAYGMGKAVWEASN